MLSNFDVKWCSFCSSKPADGIAKVLDPDNGEVDLPACFDCYQSLLRNQ